ncbi:cytochrome P450 [Pleurotus eryngii]|uniref:Cytochrome P450 n=1 Tax=Pleurotus eryngii TaxID=5323 RepID=A0A9P6DH60_PLEER|nr:cytochrome P450 [Pleurotus eryngii]
MLTPIATLDAALAGVGLFCIYKIATRKSLGPLPPGPKGLPLLGNVLDMPKEKEWLTFAKWGEMWGDLVTIKIFGQPFIILNNINVAAELLDERSAINSDRPVVPMGGELVGWKNTLVLIPYGARFRSFRKKFHQVIGTPAMMKQFEPTEEHETQKFLRRLLKSPEDLGAHVRKMAGAIILQISHGYTVMEGTDPFVTLADEATEQFSYSTAPGGFLVNLVPPLAYLPDWFPGTGFKQTAKEWAKTLDETVSYPFRFVKEQMASGTAEKSFVSALLEEPVTPEEENDIKWSAASLYTGGADTTVASNYAFFLAMTLYPEVQKKAQAELDAVVGPNRLPTFQDRPNLPYMNAVALEALRWHSVAPTSVPHRTTEDQFYKGYFIPKGTLFLTNIWKMMHDPTVYSNPSEFRPERFLGDAPERDPRDACFGFGRRICPGRVLADASVFIATAMTLATLKISKVVEDGKVVTPVVDQTTGTISHPIPFKCSIEPRSEKATALIFAEP